MSDVPACHAPAARPDWLLRLSLTGVIALYATHLLLAEQIREVNRLHMLTHSVFDLMNTMWWGILAGIVMIAILGKIPREFVMSTLGTRSGASGIVRATLAGVLLDLCSHGILMVATRLYERGASLGQTMAFLIASPWNSFSLTLILIALIGLPWTVAFIVLSILIAVITGLLFDWLVNRASLPANPRRIELDEDFRFWPEARRQFKQTEITWASIREMAVDGIRASRMVVRWMLFGILLASAVRTFVEPDVFAQYLGPTLVGLTVTMLVTTVLEVCSEGSTPIAADILTRANAPGNSFAFLMGGVSTDYTEIMVLKDATQSWKIALFLPLLTLPQIILVGWLVNTI